MRRDITGEMSAKKLRIMLSVLFIGLSILFTIISLIIFFTTFLSTGDFITPLGIVAFALIWDIIIGVIYFTIIRNIDEEYIKKHTYYKRIQLNGNETKALLFIKKDCPFCNNKLRKITEEEYQGVRQINNFGIDHSNYYGNVYDVHIYYKCDCCGRIFSLEDLNNIYENRKRNK